MKMRKEMGEGKKKEKNRAKGSKAFIRKYFIKKKTITQQCRRWVWDWHSSADGRNGEEKQQILDNP